MRALFRALLLLGFVVKFWPLLVLLAAVAVAGWLAWCGLTRHAAELERRRMHQASLVARADQQHAWILAGDDRGIYGEYPPKQIAIDAGSIAYQRLCTSEAVFGPWDL